MQQLPPLQIARGEYQHHTIEYRVGYISVQIDDECDARKVLAEAMGDIPFKIVSRYRNRWLYLQVPLEQDILELVEELNGRKAIGAAPDLAMRGAVEPNDPMLDEGDSKYQWGIECMRLFDAWDIQTGDDSVVIGLLDSGVPITETELDAMELHQTLEPCMGHDDLDGTRFIAGRNHLDEDLLRPWPQDEHALSHGTTLAGIIAARQDNLDDDDEYLGTAGVNWGSPIYTSVVLDQANISTAGLLTSGVVEAVDYAANHPDGKKNLVINISINYGTGDDVGMLEAHLLAKAMFPMFDCIVEADAVVCIAAGNFYDDDKELPYLEFPARLGVREYADNVIAVGAVKRIEDPDTGDIDYPIWEKSGRGTSDMVFAPGSLVGTTYYNNGYTTAGGTSIATAHVSALAALMWSEAPHSTAREIVACLKRSARKINDDEYRIADALSALNSVKNAAQRVTENVTFAPVDPDFALTRLIEVEIFSCRPATLQVSVNGFGFGITPGRYRHDSFSDPAFYLGLAYLPTDPAAASGTITIQWTEHPEHEWEFLVTAEREMEDEVDEGPA